MTESSVTDHVLSEGYSFVEGPCFDPHGVLHVVELANNCVSRVIDGKRSVLATLGGSPNGAAFGAGGELYVANGGGHWGANASTNGPGPADSPGLIQSVLPDGSYQTVIFEIDGVPLTSPNDIVCDGEGGFYFTDPTWPDLHPDGTPNLDTLRPGSVCYGRPDGTGSRLHTGFIFPNGIQISPDGASLIVDETGTGLVHRFPIIGPGKIGAPEVYADLGEGVGPDGMCFDSLGRLIVAGHGSHRVFVVAAGGGAVEREIVFQDPEVTNVCFGGEGFRTLYVTQASLGRIVTVEWDVAGARLFPDRTWTA